MDDVLSDAEEDEDDDDEGDSFKPDSTIDVDSLLGTEKRRGTGQVIPTKFTPPSTSIRPTELFHGQRTYGKLTR